MWPGQTRASQATTSGHAEPSHHCILMTQLGDKACLSPNATLGCFVPEV